MPIVPLFQSTPPGDEDRSLEAYLRSFSGDFPEAEYHHIVEITKTTHGYVLHTSAFETFCSHKYRKAASPIQNWIKQALKPQDQTTPSLCVGIDGSFRNDYAVWILAFDTDLSVYAATDNDPDDPRITYLIYDVLSGSSLSQLDKVTGPSFPQIPGTKKRRTTGKAK